MQKTSSRRVLIPLSSLQLTDTSTSTLDPDAFPNPDEGGATRTLPDLHPRFTLSPKEMPEFGSPLPKGEVAFDFPTTDKKRVEAWFSGDFSHVTAPESATLKKNMASAVLSTLKRYTSAAKKHNLFFSPFRIGWRYRLFDGSAAAPGETELLLPSPSAPLLIISDYNIYEKSLHTGVIFSLSPSQISIEVPVPVGADSCLELITAVEIFITAPRDMFASDASVGGVRSVNIEGIRERIWQYDAYDMANLEAAARADNDLRVVASLLFREIAQGQYSTSVALPMEAGAIDRFTTLPKAAAETGNSNTGGNSGGVTGIDGWKPFIHAETPPLDMYLPEVHKTVSSLYITGVFERSKMIFTLLASNDRQNWIKLARSHGAAVNGLCRYAARWFKVQLEVPMRKSDFLDLMVFNFKLT